MEKPHCSGIRNFEGSASALVVAALSDHVIGDMMLFPGVGWIEIASGCEEAQSPFSSVSFLRPCILPAQRPCTAQYVLCYTRPATSAFEITSKKKERNAENGRLLHAFGCFAN